MNRRTFLRAGLVLAAAPAIVRAESIMPVRVVPEIRDPHVIGYMRVWNDSGPLPWLRNETGWYTYSPNLSNYLREEVQARCRFTELASIKRDRREKPEGKTFQWNVYESSPIVIPDDVYEESVVVVGAEMIRQALK